MAQGQRPVGDEAAFTNQALGMASILLQTGILMGLVLLVVRRWTLPFGALTLIIGVSAALGVSVHEDFYLLPAATFTGLVMDMLYRWLKPATAQPGAFRLFAFLAPVAYYTLYFATLMTTSGVWWSVHMWTGAILLAGVIGWLLSYAFVPPPALNGAES